MYLLTYFLNIFHSTVIIFIVCFLFYSLAPDPPLISCQINSPKRDECIKNAIQHMIPLLHVSIFVFLFDLHPFLMEIYFQKGSSLLNIPPIDPLLFNGTHYVYKRAPFYASVFVKSATVYGLSRTQINDVK